MNEPCAWTVTVEPIRGQLSIVVRGKYPPHTIGHDEPIHTANPRDPFTLGVLENIHKQPNMEIPRALIFDALREAWNIERRAAA